MTKVQELQEYQQKLDVDPNFIDVKFYAGTCTEAADEQLAAEILVLLKGTEAGLDISDVIL